VEASEAGRRIFWRHRWLLLILMILPAAGVAAVRERQPVMYAATATVQGQDTTPDATTQVSAIQSRVDAVATDPALIQAALRQAGISRNPVQVAKHDISVSPLSSSAIMAITVTDKSRRAALALSATLATAVVNRLNELGVKGNPELALLSKTHADLVSRRNQLLSELNTANSSNAATSVQVQSLLSQLGASEQELANNESEQQQVLATLTTETGASVVSVPVTATGASRHVVVYGALAGLAGLVLGLLFATLREMLRPTVAQPAAGARELGAVLLGGADERGGQIVKLDRDLPERLHLAAHRAGVLTVVLTGPGSPHRLSSLAARLRDELPSAVRPDARSSRALAAAAIDHGNGDDPGLNGDARRPTIVVGDPRTAGLAAERPADVATSRPAAPQQTVVTLNDIRLGAPPADAALVVVLPRFAPHVALDHAADLGVTADWPILGVIGLRHQSRLAALIDRAAASPDAAARDARLPGAGHPATLAAGAGVPDTVSPRRAPTAVQEEGDDE
jgi:capsular polysaccharide biosynthesis protein